MFGGDDKDEEVEERRKREKIDDILEKYEFHPSGAPKEERESGRVRSREYQEYREAEKERRRKHWYERLVDRLGLFEIPVEDMQEDLVNAFRFLEWDVDPDRVFPTALILAALALIIAGSIAMLQIPLVFKAFAFLLPFLTLYYFVKLPVFTAQSRIIRNSDDMIISVLYMAIYMRNSPNIEGAVRFAAMNTSGQMSRDLKGILWDTEVGNYTSVEAALMDYAAKWKPYNQDYIEAIDLLRDATLEADQSRREDLLGEAINNLLDGTREKMKRYARDLKLPVSAITGMGIILPVLGIILFPMIATFLGGANLAIYLAFTYNILLPLVLFGMIRQVLLKRPPTVSAEQVESETLPPIGSYTFSLVSRDITVPAILPGLIVFAVLAAWPAPYYLDVLLGNAALPKDPSLLHMVRSMTMTVAAAWGIGVTLWVGSIQREKRQARIRQIESEFPEALFQLGNTLRRGTPIEIGIRKAVDNMQQLEISAMFHRIAYNIQEIGLTFEEAVFDPEYGAIREFPSKMIESVMRAVTESSEKGTGVVSSAMTTISTYLKNVHRTQEEIEERLSDTLSTMQFLVFALAPIISGVALALGTIITKAFSLLGELSNQNQTGGVGSDPAVGGPNLTEVFNLQGAIPPDIMQGVISVYLIELAFLIGFFYIRLSTGRSPTRRRIFTGKVLITAAILYSVSSLILIAVFGGMIAGVAV